METKDNAGEDFKYEYNYLDLGKLISKHINAVEVELEKYYKLVLFNYLFSNGDAHLKNLSLIESSDGAMFMSPDYTFAILMLH